MSVEKIPTVIIEFKGLPDFICEEQYYKENGGINGILKMLNVSRRELKEVHHKLMKSSDYPVDVWEG